MNNEDGPTLSEQVELAYAELTAQKANMQESWNTLSMEEENAIQENLADWFDSKNNDIRKQKVVSWLATNEEYQDARKRYRAAKDAFRLAQIEVERVKTMIAAVVAYGPALVGSYGK